MKPRLISLAAVLLLSLAPTTLFAKGVSIGIYAVIDDVTFEPDGSALTMIRISGVFVVPVPISSGDYQAPKRGYLYLRIRPGMEEAIRKDWEELKKAAGTGHVVGFGEYWVPDPNDPTGTNHFSLEVRVHKDDHADTLDLYPLPNRRGIVKHGDKNDPKFNKIAAQLLGASRP